jgi:cytoskeleton protein RodZ
LNGPGPEGDATAIGSYLARQRRLRGISIDELSARTRIPRRSLERLEAGAFDGSSDGFTRGFVRTVAAALGLDPDEAVLRLLGEPPEEEPAGRGRALAARVAVGSAAVLALAGLVWLALWALRPPPAADLEAAPDRAVLYRRDAVRELADELPAEPAPDAP